MSLSHSQYQCQVTHLYFSSIYIPVWSRRAWQGQLHRWCCCQGWPQRASSGWLSEPSYSVVTDSLLPAKLITTPCLLLMLISEDCIIFQHTGTKSWDYLKSKDKIQLYSWYVCCLEMSLLEGQSQKKYATIAPTPPFHIFFFNSWGIDVVLYIYINLCAGPTASSFPQCPCRSRSSVSLSCCLCVWFRGEPVSSNFSMACYSIVSYWCKWCVFICYHVHNVLYFGSSLFWFLCDM